MATYVTRASGFREPAEGLDPMHVQQQLPRLSELTGAVPNMKAAPLARLVKALAAGRGSKLAALAYAETNPSWSSTPIAFDAIKAAMQAGTTEASMMTR